MVEHHKSTGRMFVALLHLMTLVVYLFRPWHTLSSWRSLRMPGRCVQRLWLKGFTSEFHIDRNIHCRQEVLWRMLSALFSLLSVTTMWSSSASKFWSIRSSSGEDDEAQALRVKWLTTWLTWALLFVLQTRWSECSSAAAHQGDADEVAPVSGTALKYCYSWAVLYKYFI